MKWPRLTLAEPKRPAPDISERGENGVSYQWSKSSAERRLRDLDHNYEWRGANKWRICDRMRKSDPKIAGLRSAQNLPLLRAEIQITDSEDQQKVDFVRQTLLEDFPWRSFLSDVLLSIDYGFSAFAVNWRVDDDSKYRIAELRHLPCSSIQNYNIVISRGAIERIVQTPDTGGEFIVSGEYLLWFAHQKEGDDFSGRPLLRAMHKPWYTKERLEILLPVLVEKMGGVPIFTEEEPQSEVTRAALDDMGESFVLGERQYIRKPAGVGVEILASKATVGDVLEAIRYFDTQLTNVCQAQYLDLGVNQAGSRAYGTTLADMFSDSIQAQASAIEDVLNGRDGLIHQLIAYNFPTDDDLPKLRFASVQHTDIQALAGALQKLGAAGMPFDAGTWDFIRQTMDMPASTARQVVVPSEPKAQAVTPPAEETPAETGARAAEHSCGGLRLAERRRPRGVECYVALDELSGRFDDAKTAIREATEATRAKLVDELSGRAIASAQKGTLTKFVASSPPMVDRLTADIRAVLVAFHGAGKQQVADEIERQREGKPVVEIIDERQATTLAEKKPPRKTKRTAFSDDDFDRDAEVLARKLAMAVQAAAAASVVGFAIGALDAAAVAEMVDREATAEALRMGAKVSDYMQAGRADAAVEKAEEIEDAVYSAILDEAVCEVCEAMDGEVTTDLDAAALWTPNQGCHGGADRCRCVAIYEIRQEGS